MKNEHKLKTLGDILKVVTPKNVDMFVKDFEAWLRFSLVLSEVSSSLKEGMVEQLSRGQMTWIDDGKNNIKISIEVVKE